MIHIFDGKKFAEGLEGKLKARTERLKNQTKTPTLAAISVGENAASKIYLRLKQKAAERIGVKLQLIEVKSGNREILLHSIEELNKDAQIDGIMVQLPLPKELNVARQEILNTILAQKDVDGLRSDSQFLPAAAKAIFHALEEARKFGSLDRHWEDTTACVVGATGMVGRAVVHKLKGKGTMVIECDLNTRNLGDHTINADLIISVTGVPGLITGDMVKEKTVVIDIGVPKGDIDFETVIKKASFITPVPGGIGPVTVACLFENLLDSLNV